MWCQIFSMSSQLVTIPCSMGSAPVSAACDRGPRTLEGEDSSLGLRLVSDVRVLLAHANHHTLVTGTTNDRGEHLQASAARAGEAPRTARGASSPAKPALHMPDPLSITRAATSSGSRISVAHGFPAGVARAHRRGGPVRACTHLPFLRRGERKRTRAASGFDPDLGELPLRRPRSCS